jgi:rusticyanin
MALMQATLTGASVSQSSNSITFTSSSSISMTVFANTQENATRTTGMHPPSYAQGDVFVIGGLIDPTLYIPTGASVTFTLVNMDNAMYNDLVISTVGPPFASNMSQYMTWNGYGMGMMAGSGFQGFLYMMSVLSPANYAGGWAFTYSYTVTIPSYANLWYVCTYPGHGMGGMYGEIVTTSTTGTTTSMTTSSTSTTKTSLTSTSTTSVVTSSAASSTHTTSTSTSLPPGTMSISAAEALLKTPPAGANVSRSTDSITFTSRNINITAFAIMPDNATNLTGMQPPSYSKDDVFVIGGLINPTLYIPKGASIHMTVVNLDDDMYHDLVVTTLGPPYPYMMMQGMMWGGDFLYMMPVLSPANYAAGWAPYYSYTVTIPSVANLWYLCTYPGHAESGMYGEIITT